MTAIRLLASLLVGLLGAVGLVALTPAASYACSCAVATDRQHRAWADTVFTGTLTDAVPPPRRHVMSSTDPIRYTFDVDEVAKGEASAVVTVRSAVSSASCGLDRLAVGATYVVYATEQREHLWTGLCSGTREAPAVLHRPPAESLWTGVRVFLGLGTGA